MRKRVVRPAFVVLCQEGGGVVKGLVGEFAISHSSGLFFAQALEFVLFIFGVRAFEEEHIAVALKGENVGANTVEEPSVVANYHSASCKVVKTFLERSQGVHVDVVGRLIEQ